MAATTASDGNCSDVTGEKSKMITLISSDGEHFHVTEEAAGMSTTISHMIEDDCVKQGVPLPNVTSSILAKVIEYCNKHVAVAAANSNDITSASAASAAGKHDLKSFDKDFVKVDKATLFELILAANYLDIKELLDLCCQTVADMVKGMMPEEIRETFNIVDDLTPEEEAEIRRENAWAFE